MSKEDSYTSRVTRCFELLQELLTIYPKSIDEVEEDLVGNLEYYKDLATYVPKKTVEGRTIICKILPTEIRSPLVLDLED